MTPCARTLFGAMILLVLLCLGCTQIKYKEATYTSFMTDRTIGELVVTIDPNGVLQVTMRECKSEAEKVAESVSKGFAEGLK